MGPQLLLQRSVVHSLGSLISSQHITAVMRWPPWALGGSNGVQFLVSQVASVLHMPYLQPGATEAFLKEVQEVSPSLAVRCGAVLQLQRCCIYFPPA